MHNLYVFYPLQDLHLRLHFTFFTKDPNFFKSSTVNRSFTVNVLVSYHTNFVAEFTGRWPPWLITASDCIGLHAIAATLYLQPCKQQITRGHNLKLAKSCSRLNVRNNFFRLRITNLWNSLTEDIVTAPSLTAFENRLDKHWQNTCFKFEFQCLK